MDATPNHDGLNWLLTLYFFVIAAGNFVWESLHLPLYTIWLQGTRGENAFAVVHCTGGDILRWPHFLAPCCCLVRDWPRQHLCLPGVPVSDEAQEGEIVASSARMARCRVHPCRTNDPVVRRMLTIDDLASAGRRHANVIPAENERRGGHGCGNYGFVMAQPLVTSCALRLQ